MGSGGTVAGQVDTLVAAAPRDAPLAVIARRIADRKALAAEALLTGGAVRDARRLTYVAHAGNAVLAESGTAAASADVALSAGGFTRKPAEPEDAVFAIA
jgi:hypothetical protein